MLKTLRNTISQDREGFRIPKSVQDVIPIVRIWEDGVFLMSNKRYSKTYQFTDVNYSVASKEDKESMFLIYSALLNSLDSNATTKLTIINRRMSGRDFEQGVLLAKKGDSLDRFRDEYNTMLTDKISAADSMVRDLYITISVHKKNVDDARGFFLRMQGEITTHLTRLGSKLSEVDGVEKLRLLHSFYRMGEESEFSFDFNTEIKKGHSFKDLICPDTFEYVKDHFVMGKRFGRVLYLREYGSYIEDDFVSELTSYAGNLVLSIDIIPVPTDEAVREIENRVLGVETNITNWQRRQNQNNNFSAVIPYDMEIQRKESKEFLDDLVSRDQRMMLCVVTIVHTADSKEKLDSDTEAIMTSAVNGRCNLSILTYQQMDGLNTALPIGVRKIDALRTLTSESLAVLIPYRVQEIMDSGGIFHGENAISRNPIMVNKEKLLNANAFLLGVPGSGKSFAAKELIAFLALATNDDILICDPEREYASLVGAFGGEIIRVAAGSKDHINALDLVEGYGDGGNSVADKSEFVLSLFEQFDREGLGSKERSIIDRCVAYVYDICRKEKLVPTLHLLRELFLRQAEPEAKELALKAELFTSGSLNAFAHPTNVNTKSRMIVYDIMDLGRALKTMGLLVVTDQILNRVTENWRNGKRTHVFLDEFHVVFENEHSATFFNNAWRRFRKRNAYPTAITQNVEYLLDSVLASTMLSNSEFIVILNQAASDREKLARLLSISSEQMGHITNSEPGCGLIRYGSSLVPFINRWPKDTELYRLMTTKPTDEGAWNKEYSYAKGRQD